MENKCRFQPAGSLLSACSNSHRPRRCPPCFPAPRWSGVRFAGRRHAPCRMGFDFFKSLSVKPRPSAFAHLPLTCLLTHSLRHFMQRGIRTVCRRGFAMPRFPALRRNRGVPSSRPCHAPLRLPEVGQLHARGWLWLIRFQMFSGFRFGIPFLPFGSSQLNAVCRFPSPFFRTVFSPTTLIWLAFRFFVSTHIQKTFISRMKMENHWEALFVMTTSGSSPRQQYGVHSRFFNRLVSFLCFCRCQPEA